MLVRRVQIWKVRVGDRLMVLYGLQITVVMTQLDQLVKVDMRIASYVYVHELYGLHDRCV